MDLYFKKLCSHVILSPPRYSLGINIYRSNFMKQIYTNEQIRQCCFAYRNGEAVNRISEQRKIPRSTIYVWLKKYKDLPEINPDSYINYQRFYTQEKAQYEKLKQICKVLQTVNCTVSSPLQTKLNEIEKLYGQYSVHVLCEALGVSRSTFYNHILRNKRENAQPLLRRQVLSTAIKSSYEEYNGIYGARKIYSILNENGYTTSLKTVKKLMSDMGLKSIRSNMKKDFLKQQRKKKLNLLSRNFSASAPNQRWVGDITECYILEKKFYICAILDLFSRKIIAYKISNKATTQLVTATLRAAFAARGNPANLIFHSDQGCQYVSYAYQKLLHDLHIAQSFSKPASPRDNGVMESFFASLKQEEIYRIHYCSVKEFKCSVQRYIEFYNEKRPHGANAYKSPNEREKVYFESKKRGS